MVAILKVLGSLIDMRRTEPFTGQNDYSWTPQNLTPHPRGGTERNLPQEVQMRYELTFNPSPHSTSVGPPLSEDIKGEQPMCLILCLHRSPSPEPLFVLGHRHLLTIEIAVHYLLDYVPQVCHSCTLCSAYGLCSRTVRPNSCSISFSNNNIGNDDFPRPF